MTDEYHIHPLRQPSSTLQQTLESMAETIVVNLAIDPKRLRYIDPGKRSEMGITGERW